MKTTSIARAIAAVALVATTFAVASPANAAGRTLPATDALFTYACFTDVPELYAVDGATAASTLVGPGTSFETPACGYDPAYDDASGILYSLLYIGNGASALVTVDSTTGATTLIGAITDGENPLEVDSLTIAGGVAYATIGTELWTIELGSGLATSVGLVAGIDQSVYALATNPLDGRIYGFEEGGDLLQIDPDLLVATIVDTFTAPGVYDVWGLDIDSSGIFWIVTNQDGGDETEVPGLWSFDQADVNGTAVESGQLLVGGEYYYTFTAAILPVPAPALAATGVDASSILIGAGVLGLAGIVLLGARRRRAA